MIEKVNRARRYPVSIPLSYRPVGETGWWEGRAENLGRRGFSFRAQGLLKPDTQVEIMFELPPFTVGEPPAKVVSKGRISRLAGSSVPHVEISYAGKITTYKIVRVKMLAKLKAVGSRKKLDGDNKGFSVVLDPPAN